jgi:hypothetical protein
LDKDIKKEKLKMNNNKGYSAFNLNRAMRFATITTITTGLSICFIEANPAGAAIITVPFNWELQNIGPSSAQSIVYNNGPLNTPESDPKTLTALIKVIANHQAPPNAVRLDPLPTMTILNITGSFSGVVGGTRCIAYISASTGFDCYSKASASLTSPVSFTPPEQAWRNPGVFSFNIPLNTALNVAAGDYPITGSVTVNTLFGLGRDALGDNEFGDTTLLVNSDTLEDSVFGNATLQVNSSFFPGVQTTFDIRYETVPEPVSIFGTLAFGAGTFLMKRKQKLSKSTEKETAKVS